MTTLEALSGLTRLLLAFVFMSAGSMKIILDSAVLVKEWGQVMDRPAFNLRVLGAVELLAGLILVMPMMFSISQRIASVGALIVIVVMTGALFEQRRCRVAGQVFLNLVLTGLAGFVLWTHWV